MTLKQEPPVPYRNPELVRVLERERMKTIRSKEKTFYPIRL